MKVFVDFSRWSNVSIRSSIRMRLQSAQKPAAILLKIRSPDRDKTNCLWRKIDQKLTENTSRRKLEGGEECTKGSAASVEFQGGLN